MRRKTGGQSANTENNKSAIKRIDATESVKIFSKDFIASGDIGYYEPQKTASLWKKMLSSITALQLAAVINLSII